MRFGPALIRSFGLFIMLSGVLSTMLLSKKLGPPVFTALRGFHAPAQFPGHPLHPIANPQDRNPHLQYCAIALRRGLVVHGAGPPGQNPPRRTHPALPRLHPRLVCGLLLLCRSFHPFPLLCRCPIRRRRVWVLGSLALCAV